MRIRSLFAALASASLLCAGAPASHAVSTLVFTIPVNCADSDGTITDSPDLPATVNLPSGNYAVTVTGACLFGFHADPITTPCSGPAGAIPCVTVNNVPNVCRVSVGAAANDGCGVVPVTSCAYHIYVDGQCIADGVGLIYHATTGPVRASFADCCFDDNVGEFLVTLVWTPL